MKNDQWFEPGDKVVRVMTRAEFLAIVGKVPKTGALKIEWGTVYCVEYCWRGTRMNLVRLVGIPNTIRKNGEVRGYPAIAFRKVEEVQLCVRAVQKRTKKEMQPT
jgi:hypothetical protein